MDDSPARRKILPLRKKGFDNPMGDRRRLAIRLFPTMRVRRGAYSRREPTTKSPNTPPSWRFISLGKRWVLLKELLFRMGEPSLFLHLARVKDAFYLISFNPASMLACRQVMDSPACRPSIRWP